MRVIARLFTDQERTAILERVRLELIPNIDHLIGNWRDNEQGVSAKEYYQPLEVALRAYAMALRHDPESSRVLGEALSSVDYLRTEASYWRDDDEEDMHRGSDPSAYDYPWQKPVVVIEPGSRSVFDDVDG